LGILSELVWIWDSVIFLFGRSTDSLFSVLWEGQLEQPGRRKPQCTLQGFIRKVEDQKLKEVTKFDFV